MVEAHPEPRATRHPEGDVGDVDPLAIRHLRRVARAIARFWEGGVGPSHNDLDEVFGDFGILEHITGASKRERVAEAIRFSTADLRPHLAIELIALLRQRDMLDPENEHFPGDAAVDELRDSLGHLGLRLDDEKGQTDLVSFVGDHLQGVRDLPAVREHIERIQRAVGYKDASLVVGSAKELIETTTKVVLTETGTEFDPNEDLAWLNKQALTALGLHKNSVMRGDDVGTTTASILGSLSQIALRVNDFRNADGTGHGRTEPSNIRLTDRHARMAAGAAAVYCTMLLDTLDDTATPWQEQQ